MVLLYINLNTKTSFWRRSGALLLSLNFEVSLLFHFVPFAVISLATLSMYFVDWLNFANVKTIVLAFIRNSIEYNIVVYFLVSTCLYLDSRWNLCLTLTIAASVRWKIPHNDLLRWFSSERYLWKCFFY